MSRLVWGSIYIIMDIGRVSFVLMEVFGDDCVCVNSVSYCPSSVFLSLLLRKIDNYISIICLLPVCNPSHFYTHPICCSYWDPEQLIL